MKELVEVIAKALVDNPDEVVVTESENDDESSSSRLLLLTWERSSASREGSQRPSAPLSRPHLPDWKRRLWLRFSNVHKRLGSEKFDHSLFCTAADRAPGTWAAVRRFRF